MNLRRGWVAVVVAVLVGVVAIAVRSCGEQPSAESSTTVSSTTVVEVPSTTSTSTSTTSTTIPRPPPTGPPAPLTNTATYPEQTARLGRPAAVLKIDNHPAAVPQSGLGEADVVFEIGVEGISRFMAVFHANAPEFVGPIRSARYSDPDLLAMFGRPLFGDSGANSGVLDVLAASSWIVHVADSNTSGLYFRAGGNAPHNLFTNVDSMYRYRREGQPPPVPLGPFLSFGERQQGAASAAGVRQSVGSVSSTWVYDAAQNRYLRWQGGRRHRAAGGAQIGASNVVIIECAYEDVHGLPTARTVGDGAAHVFVEGQYVSASWSRPDRSSPFVLLSEGGVPVKFSPGPTWYELTDGSTAGLVSQESASALLSGGE